MLENKIKYDLLLIFIVHRDLQWCKCINKEMLSLIENQVNYKFK